MPDLARQPLEWNDTAPIRVDVSHRIAAPVATVWAAIADHASWPQWMTTLKRATPGEVADRVGGTRQVAIGPIVVDEEFLAWEPERRFAFAVVHASHRGLRTMNEDVQLTPAGEGATTVRYIQAVDVPLAKLIRPVMRRALSKGLRDGLEGLDRHLSD